MKYELPDKDVSLVWSESGGAVIRWDRFSNEWVHMSDSSVLRLPHLKGDWLPWTPPVFPERVQWRRCWATADGKRQLLMFSGSCFAKANTGELVPRTVTNIDWIDPEFIDELPPDPRGEK